MKILSIKGKNLASIEGEFAIDFRSEPLRSAGIFAITGNTGSGKTTLLDAMCIALFYKSPRTHKAKTDRGLEREDEGIKENDCRNILRHGTGDGYAEVEFLALNGKEYRSRWSVNRSRNRADGNIQPAKCELYCITENQFISKSKSENEKTIEKLLGLNYEQFTRAVLLAQGEFSAFLKASPNEKADILEKLTGTEIYARISQRIYEKSSAAEAELKKIEEKLEGIILLSPEEYAQLLEEKASLTAAAEEEEKHLSQIMEKLKWIERSEYLEKEKESAVKNVEQCNAAMEKLAATIRTIEQTEIVQPVRDTYNEALRTKKRIQEEETEAVSLGQQLHTEEEAHATAEKKLEECTRNKESIEKQRAEIEPLIIEATKIETERANYQARLKESERQLSETAKALEQCTAQQDKSSKAIAQGSEEQKQIKEWLESNAIYSGIITRCEVISTNIADANDAIGQISEKSSILEESQRQQQLYVQQLSAAQEEAEKLKATLTLEIATLRRQLVEGEPCPVCGSRHHSTAQVTENILKEKELQEARTQNEANIKRLNENIEKTRTEAASLATSIESYKKIYGSRLDNLLGIIAPLQKNDWIRESGNPIAEIEKLAAIIEETAKEWSKKSNRSTELEQQISVEHNTLLNTEKRIKELESGIAGNKESSAAAIKKIDECTRQLSAILGSAKSVDEITEYYRKEIERYGKEFSQYTLQRNELLVALTKTRQNIATLQKSIAAGKEEALRLDNIISEFLTENRERIDRKLLEELMQISIEECTKMRRTVTAANDNLLQAKAQLNERVRNIEQHAQSAVRPTGDEGKESLTLEQEQLRQQTAQRIENITQITVKLNSDKENKQRTEQLRKEQEAASAYSTDWKRLCEMFGSAKGQKFRMIAQGYTLDIMLAYANIHLKQLSSRYQLVRTAPDSLALMIIDLDMLSERRTVNTLSGGETFLVSLALALALSSLSSSNMSIESLFIDEGFGSLDSDTLRVAMEALEHLQSQGRKIGVISHLSNMIERIPTQICVKKKRGGKSSVEIKQQF